MAESFHSLSYSWWIEQRGVDPQLRKKLNHLKTSKKDIVFELEEWKKERHKRKRIDIKIENLSDWDWDWVRRRCRRKREGLCMGKNWQGAIVSGIILFNEAIPFYLSHLLVFLASAITSIANVCLFCYNMNSGISIQLKICKNDCVATFFYSFFHSMVSNQIRIHYTCWHRFRI